MQNPRPTDTQSGGRIVAVVLIVWLIAALGVSLSGALHSLRPPAPQLVIVTLTFVSLAAALLVSPLRSWSDHAPIRPIVALHLTRLAAGVYFLILSAEGKLSPKFATPAGWGDIVVGIFAASLIVALPPRDRRAAGWYMAWNALGLLDILMVVANAARVGLADPASLKPLLYLPLSLLPTFLVPLIITSHVVLFRRLSAIRRRAA